MYAVVLITFSKAPCTHKQKYLTKVFSYLFLFGLNAFLENFFIFIIRAHISNSSFEAEKKGMTNSSLNLQLLHNDFFVT